MTVRSFIAARPNLKRLVLLGLRIAVPLKEFKVTGIINYIRDYLSYRSMVNTNEKLSAVDMYPCVSDNTSTTDFDRHYFYMSAWAARRIKESNIHDHVDVASHNLFVGMLTAISHVTFIDIRPLGASLDKLVCMSGSVLSLPFPDASVSSLSCLSVAEHVGLGRYSDPLDPYGTIKACAELERVLALGGYLYFAVPIGRERVCFNAHRVFIASHIVDYFSGLTLLEFSGVDDKGEFKTNRALDELDSCEYGCGMFRLTK